MRIPTTTNTQIKIFFAFLFLFMNLTSNLVLFFGLQYHDRSLVLGAQTVRPGLAGPVSCTLGGVMLTGCFFKL
jgi:hypothetical protein